MLNNFQKKLVAAAAGLCLFALPGCSPKIVERDTVYVDRFRDRYVFRDRWRDSVSVREVHDTTTVEVKVEKNLSWAQKSKIGAFPWLLLAVIGLLLWTFRKYLFKP